MISLWITIGLIIAATLVSVLGAYFSIVGLGALFSGALVAVWLMAGSLEFAKFVLAAYLHQTWKTINWAFKIYMTFAVITLSLITSIGVFGFLSDAYQSATAVLEGETIKLENLKKQQDLHVAELERINYAIEEIPEDRVSRRLKARQDAEPKVLELNKKISEGERLITQSNLAILEVKKKVGPLIYISRSLKISIDDVVKYLILIFVSVFDPLAICLVIASTYAIESRRKGEKAQPINVHSVADEAVVASAIKSVDDRSVETKPTDAKPIEDAPVVSAVAPERVQSEVANDDVIVQMNFKDAETEKSSDTDSKTDTKVV